MDHQKKIGSLFLLETSWRSSKRTERTTETRFGGPKIPSRLSRIRVRAQTLQVKGRTAKFPIPGEAVLCVE